MIPMKQKPRSLKFLFSMLLIATASVLIAQDKSDCKVLAETLAESYEGDCKKGLADGKGKAIGTDSYEGGFKKGLPEGEGVR